MQTTLTAGNNRTFISVTNESLTGRTREAFDWINSTIDDLNALGWAVSAHQMSDAGAVVKGVKVNAQGLKDWADMMITTCTGSD